LGIYEKESSSDEEKEKDDDATSIKSNVSLQGIEQIIYKQLLFEDDLEDFFDDKKSEDSF